MKPLKIPQVGDIVSCKWLDAHADATEEMSQDEINKAFLYEFTTWGVLARYDRTTDEKHPIVAIAAEKGADGKYRGVTFIPAPWVTSLTVVKANRRAAKHQSHDLKASNPSVSNTPQPDQK